MITLIGVGHIFDIKQKVKSIIIEKKPDAVCLELDNARYNALLAKNRRNSGGSVIYRILSKFQQRIADEYGVAIGSEMLGAIEGAKNVNARIYLIDMDSTFIIAKVWNSMSIGERIKFLLGALQTFFVRREQVEKEVKRFEEDSEDYIEILGREFPTLKKFLLDDRNTHMANALRELNKPHQNIVAVVGDGHIDGIKKSLQDMGIDIIRLKKLRTQT
jgi:pheromone shutdown protein TraB